MGHVYGITRRGFGASSHPDTGYTDERLAEDVLSVMQQLKITKPVLVGHSMSGEELTRLGNEHSDLLSGLVYLAAGIDFTDLPSGDKQYMDLAHKLPAAMQPGPPPSEADRSSVQSASRWLENQVHVRFPLGRDLRLEHHHTRGQGRGFPRRRSDPHSHRPGRTQT